MRNKRKGSILLSFIVYLLCTCQPVWAGKCDWLLSEGSIVRQRNLSRHGTTEIQTVDGQQYVLRSDSVEGADRALFNTAFINTVPNHHANPLQRLDRAEAKAAEEYLGDDGEAWTVEPYVEGRTGEEFLKSRNMSDDLMGFLFEWRDYSIAKSSYFLFDTQLERELSKWPQKQLKSLAESLRREFGAPPRSRRTSLLKQVLEIISEHLKSPSIEDANKTVFLVLQTALNPEQIQMLCDLWIMATIVGIYDFHPQNWIMNGKTIVAFDLNEFSPPMAGKSVMSLNNQKHPFAFSTVTPFAQQFFIKNISPELKAFLGVQTVDSLEALRRSAVGRKSSAFHSGDIRMMLRRISYVLSSS